MVNPRPATEKVNAEIEDILNKDLEIDLDFACSDMGNAERLLHRFGSIYCTIMLNAASG